MRAFRFISGALLLAVSAAAVWRFESVFRFFLFLSPDGQVVSLMRLSLQLCLISLGPVGLALIFYGGLVKGFVRLDAVVNRCRLSRFLLYALSIGLLLRLAAVIFMPFNQWADFKDYDELAWTWVQKGGYYNGDYPTAYWPPAYPYFLSRIYLLFGHVPELGAIVNVLISLPTLLLTFLIVRRVFDDRTARWSVLILAFFPSQVLFTHLLATEMLFTLLLLLALYLFLSVDINIPGRWYLVLTGGVTLGLATLTRAVSKMLLVVMFIYWLWQSRNAWRFLKFAVLATAGFAIVVIPWIVRNHYVMGTAKINTNTGINLFIGNQPGAGMGYNSYLADQYDVNDPLQEAHVDQDSWDRAWDYIFDHPGSFLIRGIVKIAFFYGTDMDPLIFDLANAANREEVNHAVILGLVCQSYYLVVLLAAVFGLGLFFTRPGGWHDRPRAYLLLGVVAYWTALHFVFYGAGRYHFPIVPIICAFAALFLQAAVEKRRSLH